MTSRQHDNKINLYIAPKLQEQIRWLCEQISNVEWSATLFYTVNGDNFDDPDFKIVAEEVYLQDIGTSVYTEYEVTPEYIKLLMQNPRLRSMKKGHCHSHQSFGVFFSGTDKAEIMDNSEFHNYYLSLIVNNHNDMEAKVAHRVKVQTESSDMLIFKNIDGVLSSTTQSRESTEEKVFIYDCIITKPYTADDLLLNRYKEIKEKKETKQFINDLSKTKESKVPKQGNLDLFEQAWMEEQGLFGTTNPEVNEKYIDLDEEDIDLDDFPEDFGRVENFLTDFLGKGVKNQRLAQVLGNLNKRVSRNKIDIDTYLSEIDYQIFNCYYNHFPQDPRSFHFDDAMESSIEYLENNYEDTYGFIIKRICNYLDSKIDRL